MNNTNEHEIRKFGITTETDKQVIIDYIKDLAYITINYIIKKKEESII